MTSLRKGALAAAAAIPLAFAASPAAAGTTGNNITVQAIVSASCSVTVANIDFGTFSTLSGAAVDANGGITVTCTNGSPWTATAGLGNGTGATYAARKMTATPYVMTYTLFTDTNHTTVWGDGSAGNSTITGTGTGAAQSYTIYGRVAAGQTTLRVGTYTDSVAVTVTY